MVIVVENVEGLLQMFIIKQENYCIWNGLQVVYYQPCIHNLAVNNPRQCARFSPVLPLIKTSHSNNLIKRNSTVVIDNGNLALLVRTRVIFPN